MTGRCIKTIGQDSVFGPVGSDEVVSRVVSSPAHLGKHGVKASAIPNSQIRIGLSVIRMGFLKKDVFESVAAAISASIPSGTNTLAGVIQARVSDLRALPDSKGVQALCVFDDPVEKSDSSPKNDAHAIAIQAEEYNEAEILAIKSELYDNVFGKRLVLLTELIHPE